MRWSLPEFCAPGGARLRGHADNKGRPCCTQWGSQPEGDFRPVHGGIRRIRLMMKGWSLPPDGVLTFQPTDAANPAIPAFGTKLPTVGARPSTRAKSTPLLPLETCAKPASTGIRKQAWRCMAREVIPFCSSVFWGGCHARTYFMCRKLGNVIEVEVGLFTCCRRACHAVVRRWWSLTKSS